MKITSKFIVTLAAGIIILSGCSFEFNKDDKGDNDNSGDGGAKFTNSRSKEQFMQDSDKARKLAENSKNSLKRDSSVTSAARSLGLLSNVTFASKTNPGAKSEEHPSEGDYSLCFEHVDNNFDNFFQEPIKEIKDIIDAVKSKEKFQAYINRPIDDRGDTVCYDMSGKEIPCEDFEKETVCYDMSGKEVPCEDLEKETACYDMNGKEIPCETGDTETTLNYDSDKKATKKEGEKQDQSDELILEEYKPENAAVGYRVIHKSTKKVLGTVEGKSNGIDYEVVMVGTSINGDHQFNTKFTANLEEIKFTFTSTYKMDKITGSSTMSLEGGKTPSIKYSDIENGKTNSFEMSVIDDNTLKIKENENEVLLKTKSSSGECTVSEGEGEFLIKSPEGEEYPYQKEAEACEAKNKKSEEGVFYVWNPDTEKCEKITHGPGIK